MSIFLSSLPLILEYLRQRQCMVLRELNHTANDIVQTSLQTLEVSASLLELFQAKALGSFKGVRELSLDLGFWKDRTTVMLHSSVAILLAGLNLHRLYIHQITKAPLREVVTGVITELRLHLHLRELAISVRYRSNKKRDQLMSLFQYPWPYLTVLELSCDFMSEDVAALANGIAAGHLEALQSLALHHRYSYNYGPHDVVVDRPVDLTLLAGGLASGKCRSLVSLTIDRLQVREALALPPWLAWDEDIDDISEVSDDGDGVNDEGVNVDEHDALVAAADGDGAHGGVGGHAFAPPAMAVNGHGGDGQPALGTATPLPLAGFAAFVSSLQMGCPLLQSLTLRCCRLVDSELSALCGLLKRNAPQISIFEMQKSKNQYVKCSSDSGHNGSDGDVLRDSGTQTNTHKDVHTDMRLGPVSSWTDGNSARASKSHSKRSPTIDWTMEHTRTGARPVPTGALGATVLGEVNGAERGHEHEEAADSMDRAKRKRQRVEEAETTAMNELTNSPAKAARYATPLPAGLSHGNSSCSKIVVVEKLVGCPLLRKLDLSRNFFTEKGIVELIRVLSESNEKGGKLAVASTSKNRGSKSGSKSDDAAVHLGSLHTKEKDDAYDGDEDAAASSNGDEVGGDGDDDDDDDDVSNDDNGYYCDGDDVGVEVDLSYAHNLSRRQIYGGDVRRIAHGVGDDDDDDGDDNGGAGGPGRGGDGREGARSSELKEIEQFLRSYPECVLLFEEDRWTDTTAMDMESNLSA